MSVALGGPGSSSAWDVLGAGSRCGAVHLGVGALGVSVPFTVWSPAVVEASLLRLGSSLVQPFDCVRDAALSRLGDLGSFNREHEAPPVAVGQPVEKSLGDRISFERGREVGRDGHLAGLRVEFDVHLDLIARGDTGPLADLCADSDHERAAQRSHAAAVRVSIDRDADRRPFARPEAFQDLGGDPDAGGRLACEEYFGAELHGCSPLWVEANRSLPPSRAKSRSRAYPLRWRRVSKG